jgi:hypothetical protein
MTNFTINVDWTKVLTALGLSLMLFSVIGCGQNSQPPTATFTPTQALPTPTATPTPISTPTPTATPIPEPTPTPTPEPTPEPTPTPTPTPNPSPWPPIVEGHWLDIQGLTELVYPESQDPTTAWGEPKQEKTTKIEPKESNTDWMRGYSCAVKVPIDYKQNTREYPLVVYLHGGKETHLSKNNSFMDDFYMPNEDPYIIVGPTKIEWDWDAKKIYDMIQDVKANLRVDDDRIYLTGLSMGGRGTYIVASALPDLFAALMPLSSHHGPYSYVHLAPMVAHLPIWTSHGDKDLISSYDVAKKMVDELEKLGTDVNFQTISGGGHDGWDTIYRNPSTFDWLLSHQKTSY